MLGTDQAKDIVSKETRSVIDEYAARITDVLQKEKDRFRDFSRQESEKIINSANEMAANVVAEARKEAERFRATSIEEANQQAAKTIDEARKKAESFACEAGQKAKQEARELIKKDIEKLLSMTRQEAEGIIAQAKETAARQHQEMTAKAEEERAKIVKEVKEKTIEQASREAEAIVARAKDRALTVTAQAMKLGIQQAEKEIDRLLTEIKGRLESEVFGFLQEIPGKMEKIIDDTRAQMSQKSEGMPELPPENKPLEAKAAPVAQPAAVEPQPEQVSEPIPQNNDRAPEADERDNIVYEGALNLETTNATGPSQLRFSGALTKLSGVKLMSTAGSYQGGTSKTIYTVSLERPMPLIKALRGIPVVEAVSARNRDIVIKLRQDRP